MMDAILHLQGACILKELPLPTLQKHMPYLASFESFQLRGPRGKARKKRGDQTSRFAGGETSHTPGSSTRAKARKRLPEL